jgi:F-type H+-transporting ATPase subunit delta
VANKRKKREKKRKKKPKKIINIAGTEKLELVTKIDPSLIGGFVASVGSKVIDASLASQIRKLGLSLSK